MTKSDTYLQGACLRLAYNECPYCTDDKMCLLIDLPCAYNLIDMDYSIADGAIGCEYFTKAVLPLDPELNDTVNRLIWAERDLYEDDENDTTEFLRQCVDCGKWFTPTNNRQKRCRSCGMIAHKKTDAAWHRKEYWYNP